MEITNASAITGAGLSIQKSVTRTSDAVSARQVTLPSGVAGTLTLRTDNDTGTITASASQTKITTGDEVDIRWATGFRYGVTVGTVSGAGNVTIPIDTGAGDNLPSTSTALVVTKRVPINAAIDGDNLSFLGICAEYASPSSVAKASVEFLDAEDDQIALLTQTANVPREVDVAGGASNPFSGDPITNLKASNSSSSEEATLKLIWGEDSTP